MPCCPTGAESVRCRFRSWSGSRPPGIVRAATPVFKNRSDGAPACELPELSRIFATPALQWSDDEISPPRTQR